MILVVIIKYAHFLPVDTPSRLEINSVHCEFGMGLVTSFQGVIKIAQILLCSLLGHLSWGKLAALLWGHSCSPLERPTWWRFQKLRPPANSHVSAPSWKQICNPSQAFKWLQLHFDWDILTAIPQKVLSQDHAR